MRNGPKQVAVAPFGLVFDGNEAKWVDGHIYMPPRPILRYILIQDGTDKGKSSFLTGFDVIFPYKFPMKIVAIFIPSTVC